MVDIDWLRQEFIAIRKSKNLSKAKLAKISKTSQTTLYGFETGKNSPTIQTLEKWLDALGYELDIHQK